MRSKGWILGVVASCAMVPACAFGSAITIYNTGQGTVGSVDSHYTLVTAPVGVATTAIITAANPAWTQNVATASWISPGASGTTNWAAGTYDYQTTFSLLGNLPSTAQLSGLWASDNDACIYLNGANTGSCLGQASFGSLTSFSLTSGFVAGLNTLDFVVNNVAGPTGVFAEVSGTASPSAVPEPSSWILGMTGLAGAALLMFRKKSFDFLNGAV